MTDLPREIGVVVVGGGVVGLCVALFLARKGGDVAIIDAGTHAGTTANAGSLHVQMQSRFIRLFPDLVPNVEASLPLYPAAVRAWRALATELAVDIELKVSGGLMVAETAEQFAFLAAKCRREQALGLDVDMLDRTELERIAPCLGPVVVGAEFCRDEGKVNPLLANRAILAAAKACGVVHAPGVRVEELTHDRGQFKVSTRRGDIVCGRVVLAAGAGTGALAARLGAHVPTRAEPLHMNITEPTAPLVEHLIQHAERSITLKQLGAGQVVIGGGWPARIADQESPPVIELDSLIGNLSLAQHIVPKIGGLHLLRTWAGINTTTDGASVLGELPGHTGCYVAVPGDAGYTLGPLCARLLVDAMAGRRPDFDIARYSPARFRR